MYFEVNADSIIGPTHHFGGLSYGNVASMVHGLSESNPRKAALQGLNKVEKCLELGVPQLLFPPQVRPAFDSVKRLGFKGTDELLIQQLHQHSPHFLSSIFSSSFMWMANAGIFSPSCDTLDSQVHFTAANLVSSFHRHLESYTTYELFQQFLDPLHSFVHLPLLGALADEGAANYIRLSSREDNAIHFFVFSNEFESLDEGRYPRRQSKAAFEAISRLHRLNRRRVVYAKQHTEAINAGVFHNDVISFGFKNVLVCHEKAYENKEAVYEQLSKTFHAFCSESLIIKEIKEADLSLAEAVSTYLFNSQVVTSKEGKKTLLAPNQCKTNENAKKCLENLLNETSLDEVCYLEVNESMNNGGAPACLRLRMLFNEEEYAALESKYKVTPRMISDLRKLIENHYLTSVHPNDFLSREYLKNVYEANYALSRYFRKR